MMDIKPGRPEIRSIAPVDAQPPAGVSVVAVGDGRVPPSWLAAGPVAGTAETICASAALAALAGATAGAGAVLDCGGQEMKLSPLAAEAFVPAGHGRIELSPLIGGDEPRAAALLAVFDNDAERIVRVHLARLRSVLHLGGQAVCDGDFVRLGRGLYPAVVVVDNRKDYPWDPLYVAPRLVPCTEAQVGGFHGRRVAAWQVARDARAADPHALGRQVRVLPHTVIGTEGFVRVGRTEQGYWWFIDADGAAFYYQGVTSINRAGTQGGRRAAPGPYAAAVDARHDYAAGPDAFVDSVVSRLGDWGFNGMGAWTTEEFFEKGLFYTDNVEFLHGFPRLPRSRFVDVFDPAWREFIDAKAREVCTPQRHNKLLVGYFTENEIGFPTVGTVPLDAVGKPILTGARPSLLQNCLAEAPEACAWREAWRFVLDRRGGGLAEAGRAWGVEMRSRDDVARLSDAGEVLVSDGFRDDADAFAAHCAETFFRWSALAIRRHDPSHLVLGCRWAGPPDPAVLAAESRWADVISLNNYQDMFYERIGEYANVLDLPILIGEFCWNDDAHMTIRMPFEDPVGLTAAERMIESGSRALLRVFRHPNVVGWTWYRWIGENPLRSPRNCGLVDENDDAHPWNVRGLTLLHPHAEGVRIEADRATTTGVECFDGCLVVVLQRASFADRGARRNAQKVVFGVECVSGRVAETLAGYGLRGRVCEGRFEADTLRFRVELAFTGEVFRRGVGEGRYDVELTADRAGHLTGAYRGTLNGEELSGPVSAWRED